MTLSMTDQEFVRLNKDSIQRLIELRADEPAKNRNTPKRRRIQRWPFPGPVQLWFHDSTGEETQIIGTCHNLNENGIGLFCERAFDIGRQLPVAIHQPEATYHGDCVVRHCTQSGGEYFLGLEFVDSE